MTGRRHPGWSRLRELAEPLLDSDTIRLPHFIAELMPLSAEDERQALRSYAAGLRPDSGTEARERELALAAAICPVVAEPCVWLAHAARARNDHPAAQAWASTAQRRLHELGTTWDKRLSFDEWLALADAAAEPTGLDATAPAAAPISDPRQLFEEAFRRSDRPRLATAAPSESSTRVTRFHRYIDSLGDGDQAGLGRIYPELDSHPWYEANVFPLARYLEDNFSAIQKEILALDPALLHRESERISRSGEWDVAFFYERGRRRDDLCAACPVTARGIDAYPAMRTITGLIYVSRMRAGTHIAAHRGPTNLRLRCHLGIEVPSGDCAIRVADETRQWVEGRCLVFDDFFEHEAWNHTDHDRIVLIADLWHPDLSAAEVRLIEGLHRYTYAHARKLDGFWASNAAAARTAADKH